MRNRWVLFLVLLFSVFTLVSCDGTCDDDWKMSENSSSAYTYSLTETSIQYDEALSYGDWYNYRLLRNGAILERRFASTNGGAVHYYNFVYDENGEEYKITYSNDKYRGAGPHYRMVLETDTGDVIVSNNIGETELYGEDWELKETVPDLYFGYTLDGGRYFAFNDKELVEITYAIGVDGYQQKETYALYRYTEKLTDTKYNSIIDCEGGFECTFVDEKGNVQVDFYSVADKAPHNVPEFTVKSVDGKYCACDNDGNVIVDKDFDYLSEFLHNRAIVIFEKKVYVLEINEK